MSITYRSINCSQFHILRVVNKLSITLPPIGWNLQFICTISEELGWKYRAEPRNNRLRT